MYRNDLRGTLIFDLKQITQRRLDLFGKMVSNDIFKLIFVKAALNLYKPLKLQLSYISCSKLQLKKYHVVPSSYNTSIRYSGLSE
jgi:hypothetical protein